MMTVAIALTLTAAAAAAPQTTTDDVQRPRIVAALQAIQGGHPQEAIATIDPVIAAYDADLAKEKRQVYCGMNLTETLAYLARPDPAKRGAVALTPGYCEALYLKGFALIDLGRIAEARAYYQRVVALAPMHAHFLTELGQSYRYTKEWPTMLDTCRRAEEYAGLANDNEKQRERIVAWHCQGYALSELGKLDEAEKLYRQCLELDPDDRLAKNELQYIAEQRAKRT